MTLNQGVVFYRQCVQCSFEKIKLNRSKLKIKKIISYCLVFTFIFQQCFIPSVYSDTQKTAAPVAAEVPEENIQTIRGQLSSLELQKSLPQKITTLNPESSENLNLQANTEIDIKQLKLDGPVSSVSPKLGAAEPVIEIPSNKQNSKFSDNVEKASRRFGVGKEKLNKQPTEGLISIKSDVHLPDIRSKFVRKLPKDIKEANQLGWEHKEVTGPKPVTELLKNAESSKLRELQIKDENRKAYTKERLQKVREKKGQAALLKSADARIVTTPEYLVFYKIPSGSAIQPQTFTITNGATGTLNYSLSETGSWLSLNSSSGSVPAGGESKITVSIDASGLSSTGSPYIADITVTNQNVPADTKIVRARLSVFENESYVKTYTYDSNGNLVRRITPDGYVIEYKYDVNNRLANIFYPEGTEVEYTYDENGNRLSMTDATGTTYYAYDEFNRLAAVQASDVVPTYYQYDNANNLTEIIYPTQEAMDYTYDADNRLKVVKDNTGTTTYNYDTNSGNLIKQTLPNGVTTDYVYDLSKRITDVVNKKSGGALISSYHYSFDANNNRTQIVETTPEGAKTTNYTYDKLNRLTRADYSDGTFEAYTYDAAGNRLTQQTQSGTVNYEYDSDNRLIKAGLPAGQAGKELFFYDKAGNLIKKVSAGETTLYFYDFENRLIDYEDNENVVAFEYNGDGQRVTKTVNGLPTYYINDVRTPLTQVLLEANSNWQVTKIYRYGLGRLSQEEF